MTKPKMPEIELTDADTFFESWFDDPAALFQLDDLLLTIKPKLQVFLDTLHNYEAVDQNYFLLFSLGKLSFHYSELRKDGKTPVRESLLAALSKVANDPVTQSVAGAFLGQAAHKVGGGE